MFHCNVAELGRSASVVLNDLLRLLFKQIILILRNVRIPMSPFTITLLVTMVEQLMH